MDTLDGGAAGALGNLYNRQIQARCLNAGLEYVPAYWNLQHHSEG